MLAFLRPVIHIVLLTLTLTLTLTLAFVTTNIAAQTLYTGHALLRPLFKSAVANTQEPFRAYANFTQTFINGVSSTTISVTARGLQAGKSYGLHVHAWGDLSSIFNSNGGLVDISKTPTLPTVGGHFDVMGRGPEAHGCKDVNATRHTGDVGVLKVAPTTTPTQWVTYTFTSELLDLGADGIANNSIIGRSLVLHENPDPCYQIGAALGGWVGIGLVGINWVPAGIKQAAGQERTLPITTQANALVYNFDPNTNVPVGNLRFWTDARGILRISGSVSGFDANSVHGVHIHAFGNEDNAAASGGHFGNGIPGLKHGLPPTQTREYGDLGNMMADAMGVITFDATKFYNTELVSLYRNTDDAPGARSIIGRAIVFHAIADDGNMFGGRLAAGVIGLVNAATPRPSPPPSMPSQASAYAKLIPYYSSSIANTDTPLSGSVLFTQSNAGGVVSITVTVSGLRGGRRYGLHVHQWGDLSGMFDLSTGTIPTDRASFPSVAGHFNPFNQPHGCAGNNGNASRHVGDIGNLVLPADIDPKVPISFFLQSELLDLGRDNINGNSILGRAIVLHENQDKCTPDNLGAWLAVSTIGVNDAQSNTVSQDPDLPLDTKANAAIFNSKKGATGNVWFWSGADGAVHMSGRVFGFAPNSQHGVHIHQFANQDDHDEMHPNEPSHRDVGDLGHLLTADAEGVIQFTDLTLPANLVSLTSMSGQSIIGRSIDFHDFDPTGTSSKTAYHSSNSGVIGLADSSSVSPFGPSPSNPTLNPNAMNSGSSLLVISSPMHMYVIVHMLLYLVFLYAFSS